MRVATSKSPLGYRNKEVGRVLVEKSPIKSHKEEVKLIADRMQTPRKGNTENSLPLAKKNHSTAALKDMMPLKKSTQTDYETERLPLKPKQQNITAGTRSTSALLGTPTRPKQILQRPGNQSPRTKSPLTKSPSLVSQRRQQAQTQNKQFGITPKSQKSKIEIKVDEADDEGDYIHCSGDRSNMSSDQYFGDDSTAMDRYPDNTDGQKLLDGLKAVCLRDNEYNANKLVGEFAKIVHRTAARKTQDFMPESKCTVSSDGRKALKIGETRIFYDESVISQILDLGVRSKQSN
jgi:hypothetical protein